MAWNGSGVFTRTNGTNTGAETWQDDAAASTKILASRHDTHDEDLATGLNACLTKNNETKPTADFAPNATASYDLGTTSLKWQDLVMDGVGYMASLNVWGDGNGATNRLKLTYNSTSGAAVIGPDSGTGNTTLSFGTSTSGTYTEAINVDANQITTLSSDLVLTEAADHASTPAAGKGYIWVKNDAPSSLKFTDDAGNDHSISGQFSCRILTTSVSAGSLPPGWSISSHTSGVVVIQMETGATLNDYCVVCTGLTIVGGTARSGEDVFITQSSAEASAYQFSVNCENSGTGTSASFFMMVTKY